MAKFYVQMEVALSIGVEVEAEDLAEAIAEGEKLGINDLVSVKKGSKEDWNVYVHGVFADATILNQI